MTRLTAAVLMIAALMIVTGATSGALALLAPGTVPRIQTITHDARGPLRTGQRITVTMRGTGSGAATFHIFGVIANVGMREIRVGAYQAQPALYTGTYTVRPEDIARNAAVLVTLAVGGQEVTAASNRPVTIDTRGPVITSRQPKPGATLTNVRPNIVVNFLDAVSAVNPGAVRLVVNDQNVTARTSISETSAAFNPEGPFPPGPVRVQLTATDRAGNQERVGWSFTIAPTQGLINSVTINPATPLTPGDILTVVMSGAPGGRASFTIQGLPGVVAMRESRTPGVYFGTLQIEAGRSLTEGTLLVTLEKNGQRGTAAAAAGVTIVGPPPPAPSILAPGQAIVLGQEAVVRMILRGRARPGLRILARVSYVGRGASADEAGALGEFLTVTGADGNWAVAIGPLIVPEGSKVVASVIAIDHAGQRSPAASREVAEAGQ